MNKLKPCPFCGRAASLRRVINVLKQVSWRAGCDACSVVVFVRKDTPDTAIAAWNTRTPQADKEEK